jgi:hypothetical protein
MENRLEGNKENLSHAQAVAKAALLGECDRLAAAGVTFVAVHFDGCGDDGATEEVKCYDSECYAWGEHEPAKHDASHLQEYFEALVRSDTRTIAADSETWSLMSARAS